MWIYVLCSVAWVAIVILTVIQIARRTDLTETVKRVWMAIIVIAPVVGLIIYYVAATPKKLV